MNLVHLIEYRPNRPKQIDKTLLKDTIWIKTIQYMTEVRKEFHMSNLGHGTSNGIGTLLDLRCG